MVSNPYQDDRLYSLLPAIYRRRDAEMGEPLRGLLSIVAQQADLVHADIGQLWDDMFIETCRAWVVPYIGDLVGNETLYDDARLYGETTADELFPDLTGPLRPRFVLRTRADVAKTIYYRRRKGTVPMLEELARDVTGWPAHAAEMFRRLVWTQHLDFPAFERLDCARLTEVEPIDRLDGAFDRWGHTVDVREPAQQEGWHGIPNLALFLWRLRAFELQRTPARQGAQSWQHSFSPLGQRAPLFSRRRREAGERELATELDVPGPIRRARFFEDLRAHRRRPAPRGTATELYGDGGEHSLHVWLDGNPVPATSSPSLDPPLDVPVVVCRRLDPWPTTPPSGAVVAIDVDSGRLALGDGLDPVERVEVTHHYGFTAELGGGPYEREPWLVDEALDDGVLWLEVEEAGTTAGSFTTLGAALAQWQSEGRPNAVVTILDNRTYAEPLQLSIPDGRWLVIQAANLRRPHLRPTGGEIELTGTSPDASLTLSGVLVEGGVHVRGDLGRLRLLHSTLVPGRALTPDGAPATTEPSVVVEGSDGTDELNADFELQAAFSILGPVLLPRHAETATVLDCVVDGLGGAAIGNSDGTLTYGPSSHLERTTVLGTIAVKRIEASECIFVGLVRAEQLHEGCVRLSYVPPGSRVPRRFRCQPGLAVEQATERALADAGPLSEAETLALRARVRAREEGRVVPSFVELRYGQPAYAQLRLRCASEITTGAEDGSEMGALCHLKQAQRETNLRIRLREYLPFGLVPGIIYVT